MIKDKNSKNTNIDLLKSRNDIWITLEFVRRYDSRAQKEFLMQKTFRLI